MKQLKRLIAVYAEDIVVKGHYFRVETSRDVMKDKDDSLYGVYDLEKGDYDYLVASTIWSYKGIIEVAEAYLTGDKQALEEAERKWCICH